MRDFLLDIACFLALAGALEACADRAEETNWGSLDYVHEACDVAHTALKETCHPPADEDDNEFRRGRSRSGGKR